MLGVLLIGQMIMWTLYGNITVFYPRFVSDNHKSINSLLVGVTLAMFEASVLLSSPLVSLGLQRVGRKRFIIIGNICMILATVGFGLTYHIKDDTIFLLVSIALRLVQGFGDAACSTSIFSIIGQEFPNNRDEFLGYVEGAVGMGLMAGPIIGQLIFNLVGYQWTFYVSGILIALPLIA